MSTIRHTKTPMIDAAVIVSNSGVLLLVTPTVLNFGSMLDLGRLMFEPGGIGFRFVISSPIKKPPLSAVLVVFFASFGVDDKRYIYQRYNYSE